MIGALCGVVAAADNVGLARGKRANGLTENQYYVGGFRIGFRHRFQQTCTISPLL